MLPDLEDRADHPFCRYRPSMTDGRDIEISANGLTFHGLEWGPAEGRLVLLLHGFPQRSTSWAPVAGRLAASGRRVVAVDQRGYSPGARPAELSAYSRAELVADVAAVIDALGGPVDLVGHDWGGVVGWQVAMRHPDKVRTWTAISTPNPQALNAALEADEQQRNAFGYILVFREPGRAEAALLDNDAAGLRAIYGGAVPTEIVEPDVAFFARPGVLSAALNWYRAMDVADVADLTPITVPTTYIWGADDIAFLRTAAESTGEHVTADYRFVPLEGVSHWVPNQAADTVADEILRRVDSS
jgi:pimeloyl-ACP methyl ester carboxylesterase